MLDQLVESKEHSAENTRKSELLIGIATLAVVVLIVLWTQDLFAHGFGVEGGDLELTTLVAPPPPPDEPPPPWHEPARAGAAGTSASDANASAHVFTVIATPRRAWVAGRCSQNRATVMVTRA